ncbi:hypothetical protein ACMBCN_03480 [Candidatus Liberibacter asiaticus]|nr:hypothetical protein [Candidatus Liberibacter asiaticus]
MCKDSIIYFKLTIKYDSFIYLFIILFIIIYLFIYLFYFLLNNLNNSPKPKLHNFLNVFNYVHIQRKNKK